jgi:hypothetical protein
MLTHFKIIKLLSPKNYFLFYFCSYFFYLDSNLLQYFHFFMYFFFKYFIYFCANFVHFIVKIYYHPSCDFISFIKMNKYDHTVINDVNLLRITKIIIEKYPQLMYFIYLFSLCYRQNSYFNL